MICGRQEFGRKRKKVSEIGRLNKAYDHAYQFHQLKQTKLPLLNIRQYLNCCFQCTCTTALTHHFYYYYYCLLLSLFVAPFKLFAERYLNPDPEDHIRDLPQPVDDDDIDDQVSIIFLLTVLTQIVNYLRLQEADSQDELNKRLKTVEEMIDKHILTDECLNYLKEYVTIPSEALHLYRQRKWSKLSLISTVGIFENSKTVTFFF